MSNTKMSVVVAVVLLLFCAGGVFAQNAYEGATNGSGPLSAALTFQQSNTTIVTYWSSFGSVANYMQVTIYTNPANINGSIVFTSTVNGIAYAASSNYTNGGLALTSGTTYYVQVNSYNSSNVLIQSSTNPGGANVNGVTVDTAAPAPGTVTNSGGGTVSGAFQSSSSAISGSWANWGDALSGMASGTSTYSVGVVNAAGTQIQAMTNYSNTATSVSFTGLALVSGTKYYVVMTGKDAVGNVTAIIYSNGITVDTAAPTGGTATNSGAGVTATVNGITYQSSGTYVNAGWTNWSDALSGMAAGANTYQVGVLAGGTGAGSNYTVALTNYANGASSASFTGLALTNGTTYYVALQPNDAVGNSTLVYSSNSGVIVDTAAPVAGTLTIPNSSGPGNTRAVVSGITYQTSTTYVDCVWTNWNDALSGMFTGANTYQVGVLSGGTGAGSTYIVALTNYANGATNALFTGLALTSGTSYYIAMTGKDAVGNVTAVVYSNQLIVDIAAPIAGAVNDLGGGVTAGAFQSSTTYINGSWANWGDALSGMFIGASTYQVGIVTSNGTQVVALTNYANGATSASFTGLALVSGTKYYVVMTGKDAVGNVTAIIYSNGVTVDTSTPTVGTVTDAGGGVTAGAFQSSNTYINFNWTNFGDTVGLLSGANTYSIGIVNAAGTQIVAMTTYASGATSGSFTGLGLASGTKYYVVLTAQDTVGNTTAIIYSNGVTVDSVSPVAGTVTNTGAGTVSGAFQSSNTTVNAAWANWGDATSGMLVGANTYQVGVGTTPGATDVVALTNYSNAATSASFTGLALTSGTQYYVTVKGQDGVGNTTTANSTGITVDTAVPTGTLSIPIGSGPTNTMTTVAGNSFQSNATYINLTWSFGDALSGMFTGANTYQVGVIVWPNTTVVALTNYSNATTSASFTGLALTSGTKYYGIVKAQDAVGNVTATIYSNAVTVDTAAPVPGTTTIVPGGTVILFAGFQSASTYINGGWANWGDALSGMLTGANTYSVGVVSSNGTQIQAMTNYANTATSCSFTGLVLTNGTKYYVVMTGQDAVGNTTAIIYSNGVVVDTDVPTGTTTNAGAGTVSGAFQSSGSTINASWSNFGDAGNGMLVGANTYQVGVQIWGGANVVALTNYANTTTSATFTGLALTSGTKYYVIMIATDIGGFATSTLYSNGITVDTGAPAGTINNVGAGTVAVVSGIYYQNSTTSTTANWSFNDALSGMLVGANTYVVSVGTAPGSIGGSGGNIVAATNYANTTTGATFSGLAMSSGTKFYFNVLVQDNVGNTTTVGSNPAIVDTVAPVAGTVTNNGGGVVSGAFQSSNTYINGNWANWGDALSGMLTGANTYSVGVVNAAGTQIVAMTNYANTATSCSFTGLALTSGTKYYVVMTGQDAVGNTTAIIYSNGITVDTGTGFSLGAATATNNGGGVVSGAFQSSATYINASWANFADTLSGIATYQVGILANGVGVGFNYVAGAGLTTYANTASSATFSGLALSTGGVYFVAVRAIDNVGNASALIYSSGVTLDTTAPVAGTVTNSGAGTVSGAFQSSATTINGSWANWTDANSGMFAGTSTYTVGVVTSNGSQVVAMTNYSNAATSTSFTGLTLTSGTKYYVVMTGKDAVGNVTGIIYSNGITVETTGPNSGTVSVVGTAGTGGALFQKSNNTITVNWSNFGDSISGMLTGANTYQVGVGTAPGSSGAVGGTVIQALTNYSNAASTATFSGLALTSGTSYYVTIVASNAVAVTATFNSASLTVDTVAPVAAVNITNSTGATIAVQNSIYTVYVGWTGSDALSGMATGASTYQVGVVTNNNGSGAFVAGAALTNYANTATSATFTGLNLTVGSNYYAYLTASDAVGNSTALYSSAVLVTSGPANGSVTITNATGATIIYQNYTDKLYASFSGWNDLASAITQYQVGIVTAAGPTGTYLVPLTTITPGAGGTAGTVTYTSTSATFTALALANTKTYFVQMVATDAAVKSTSIYSAGVTVDTIGPTGGTATNGTAINFQASATNAYTNWSGFVDTFEGLLPGTGTYQVGLINYSTGAYVVALTNYASTTSSANFTGLILANGTKYYFQVTAFDMTLNPLTVYSNTFTVDSTGPTAGTVSITGASTGTSGLVYQTSNNTINATWANFSDSISGMASGSATYKVGIGTAPGSSGALGGTVVYALSNFSAATSSYAFTNLSLTSGTTYYVTVVASDAVANTTTVNSSGVAVDTTPPVSGTISTGGTAGTGGELFQTSANTITATWSGFSDATSGMAATNTYQVGVQIWGGANVYALSNFSAATSTYSFTNLTLTTGTKYYGIMTAKDAAGNTTSVIYSNGVTVDAAAPVAGTVNITNGSTTAAITNQNWTDKIYVNWANWADANSGMAATNTYQVSVIANSTGTAIAGPTNFGPTSSSATFSGLTLSNQAKYYAQIVGFDVVSNSTLLYTALVSVDFPVAGVLNNGAGANISSQSSTSAISANWSGFSDTLSGVLNYTISIGTTVGGTNVVNSAVYANTTSTATFTGLALTAGTNYYITIKATNGVGFVTTVNGTALTVSPAPTGVTLTPSPTSGTAPVTITFTSAATSVSAISNVAYNFGDGTTASALTTGSVTHSYTTAGTYYASVTVTNGSGSTSATAAAVVVSASPSAPQGLTLSITPTSGTAPLTVTATFGPTGNSAYNLDFTNNGSGVYNYTSNIAGSATFTYNLAGTYTVYYNAVNSSGLGATLIYGTPITVTVPAGSTAPTFTSGPSVTSAQPAALGAAVTFYANASPGTGAAAGTGIYYTWDFTGGGTPQVLNKYVAAGGDTETFSYTTSGTFTVKCTVSDSNGSAPRLSASATTSATVAAPAPTSISVFISSPSAGAALLKNAGTSAGSSVATIAFSAQPYSSVNFSTSTLQYNSGTGFANAVTSSLLYSAGSGTLVWDYTGVPAVAITLQMKLTDNSGTVWTSSSVSITVTTAPATATLGQISATTTYTSTVAFFTLSPSSATTGVTDGNSIAVVAQLPALPSLPAGAKLYMDTFSSTAAAAAFSSPPSGTQFTGFCDMSITTSAGTPIANALTGSSGAQLKLVYSLNSAGNILFNGVDSGISSSASTTGLMHYDTALNSWNKLAGQNAVIDSTAKTLTITATTPSFSPFALAGAAIAAAAAGGGGAGGGAALGALAAAAVCGTTGFDALLALGLVLLMNRYLRRRKAIKS